MLERKWSEGKFVCVGLDSELGKIPESAHQRGVGDQDKTLRIVATIVVFNRRIVEATRDIVCAYKPNIAFYLAHGVEGLSALHRTIVDIHILAPDVPVILDCKVADIGNTNMGYVSMAFDFLQADAITVHPYLGGEALNPFLERADKGIIVLCRTSNSGAGEFQDLFMDNEPMYGEPVYLYIARRVATAWNKNGNCGVVVGATYPEELRKIRGIVGDIPILIPGIGAQGGDVEKTVSAGKNSCKNGMIINSSRGIIFASKDPDFAEAARREAQKLHDLINQYR